MAHAFWMKVALATALGLQLAGVVRAQPVDAPEAAAPAGPGETAGQQLAAADAALDAGDLARAHSLYDQVVRDHPQSAEAREARRALKILLIRLPAGDAPPAAMPPDVVVRQEPYSLRTSERMRLTTWEKLDFGVTSFLYGLSVGFSFGLSKNSDGSNEGAATAAMALGALTYTAGSIGYLTLANPSRGDLPLALGIASYLPTTTLLVANLAQDHPDDENVALATAATGLLAVPLAVAATHWLDLDPGDTQLVRDAGFWGLVLGTAGTLGFAARPQGEFGFQEEPEARTIALGGLAGLYGGLALGALAASQSEVSLERVRVSTWGGYGGALVGALLASTSDNDERDIFRGIAVGGLLGVTLSFVLSYKLDGIPADTPLAGRRLFPTVASVPTADGGQAPAFGLMGALP